MKYLGRDVSKIQCFIKLSILQITESFPCRIQALTLTSPVSMTYPSRALMRLEEVTLEAITSTSRKTHPLSSEIFQVIIKKFTNVYYCKWLMFSLVRKPAWIILWTFKVKNALATTGFHKVVHSILTADITLVVADVHAGDVVYTVVTHDDENDTLTFTLSPGSAPFQILNCKYLLLCKYKYEISAEHDKKRS